MTSPKTRLRSVPAEAPIRAVRQESPQPSAELELLLSAVIGRIAAVVATEVQQHLADAAPAEQPLLDRQALAKHLGISLPTLDKLRDEGLPELEFVRFELEPVMSWLRTRAATRSTAPNPLDSIAQMQRQLLAAFGSISDLLPESASATRAEIVDCLDTLGGLVGLARGQHQ